MIEISKKDYLKTVFRDQNIFLLIRIYDIITENGCPNLFEQAKALIDKAKELYNDSVGKEGDLLIRRENYNHLKENLGSKDILPPKPDQVFKFTVSLDPSKRSKWQDKVRVQANNK